MTLSGRFVIQLVWLHAPGVARGSIQTGRVRREIRRKVRRFPKAYAHFESNAARGSKLDHGNSGGCMKRMRFAAVFCLACLALILSSGCGGGSSSTISIVLVSANGLLTMDESPARLQRLAEHAEFHGCGGRRYDGGGSHLDDSTKQSGCASDGKLTAGSCGTLTNNAAFAVTSRRRRLRPPLSVVITATSVTRQDRYQDRHRYPSCCPRSSRRRNAIRAACFPAH